MKYKWSNKITEGSKVYKYCLNADLPPIIFNKDDTYTVKCQGVKPMTYDEWKDAEKRAIEVGEKKAKEVRKFNRKEAENNKE